MGAWDMLVRINADTSGLRRGVSDASSSLTNLNKTVDGHASHMGLAAKAAGGLKSALEGVSLVTGGVLAIGFADSVKRGLDMQDMIEKNSVALSYLTGSMRSAKDMQDKLWSLRSKSPIDLQTLDQSAEKLLALGTKAKDVVPDLQKVADAAAGSGLDASGFQGIVSVLGRIHQQGQLTSRDMRTLVNDNIPAWDILAKKLHMTVADVHALLGAGAAGAASSSTATAKALEAAQSKATKTRASIDQQITLTEAHIKQLEQRLTLAASAKKPSQPHLLALNQEIDNAKTKLSGLETKLGGVGVKTPGGKQGPGTGVASSAQLVNDLLDGMGQKYKGAAEQQSKLFGPQMKILGDSWARTVGGVIMPPLNSLAANVLPKVSAALDKFRKLAEDHQWKKAFETIIPASVVTFAIQAFTLIKKAIIDLKPVGEGLASIFGFLVHHTELLKVAAIALGSAFMTYKILSGVVGLVGAVRQVSQAFIALAGSPMGLILLAVAALSVGVYELIKHWGAVKAFFTTLFHDVEDIFNKTWTRVRDFVVLTNEDINQFFMTIWKGIEKFFFETLDSIVNKFVDAYNKFVEIGGKYLGLHKVAHVNWGNDVVHSTQATFAQLEQAADQHGQNFRKTLMDKLGLTLSDIQGWGGETAKTVGGTMTDLQTIMSKGGGQAAAAFVSKLDTAGQDTSGIVHQYAVMLANNMNPVLAQIGGKQIVTSNNAGWTFNAKTPGVVHMAQGGINPLPNSATIAAGRGRGLVNWAEGETGGEAFIPLAPSKRQRSLGVWAETGRRLGIMKFNMGGILTPQELASVAASAGFPASQLQTAVAVAEAESGGDRFAQHVNAPGLGVDEGLWQINSVFNKQMLAIGPWSDPLMNAKMAEMAWAQRGWRDWVTYTTGAYRRFMGAYTGTGAGLNFGSAGGGGSVPALNLPQPPHLAKDFFGSGQAGVNQLFQQATAWASTLGSQMGGGSGGVSLPTNLPAGIRGDIIKYAASFFGVPYLWGGTTPGGFDCSGLVQYVFKHFGIGLPRVSQDQQHVGHAVSTAQAQPADLVFFGNPAHHIGLYMGNGQMIDAPHTGTVVRVDSAFKNDFSGVRSVFANGGIRSGTYDSGGLLMPGLTLAYNGTGKPEAVTKMASGGFTDSYTVGGSRFDTIQKGVVGEIGSLTGSALTNAFSADAQSWQSYMDLQNSRLADLQAVGASLKELEATQDNIVNGIFNELARVNQEILTAKQKGLSADVINGLWQQWYKLRQELETSKQDMAKLIATNFDQKASAWARALDGVNQRMSILKDMSSSTAVTPLFQQQFNDLAQQYGLAEQAMSQLSDPTQIQAEGKNAIDALMAMYGAAKEQLNRQFQQAAGDTPEQQLAALKDQQFYTNADLQQMQKLEAQVAQAKAQDALAAKFDALIAAVQKQIDAQSHQKLDVVLSGNATGLDINQLVQLLSQKLDSSYNVTRWSQLA